MFCKDPYRCAEEIVLTGRTIGNPLGGYELGVSNISDFSAICKTRSGKDSLFCSDLMSVYGQNNEYWEDSVARDKSLHEKFNDKTAPEKKMNSYRGERDSFDHKAIDVNTQRQLDLEEKARKQQEMIRNNYLNKVDKYYSQNSRIKF